MTFENEERYDEDLVEKEINLSKVYSLPDEICIVKYKEVYLAIYTEGVLWIVLKNKEELEIFNLIRKGENLENLFKKYSEDSIINVVMQIEAKKFDSPEVNEFDEKNVCIYLTNNCNERCKHCYMYAGDIKIEEMNSEKWITVLNKLVAAGCEGVTFTGGEVTVYKGFEKIIKHAHEIGLAVTVLSNGILWDEQMVKNLSPFIDEIQISIDGYDSESYYSVRRYDGFDKAMNCIELFTNTGTKVSMAVTPLYENLDVFIDKFESFAKNFLSTHPDVFVKLNHELIVGREVNTTEDENKEYRRKLKKLVERLYPDYYNETFVLNYENKAIRRNCGFGGVSIAANGDVYWCNRIHELNSTMNVFKCDMDTIFKKSKWIKDNTSVDNTIGCMDCEVKYICGGVCRMKYEGIKNAEKHLGEWKCKCDGKEHLYEKMIRSNEYFFE